MTTTNLQAITIGEHAITYDRHGDPANPTVVLLTGWCQDHRLFDPLVPYLAGDFDVLRIDWRGHGQDRSPVPDFGPAEQAGDVLAVLDALGVDRFLPLSTSHGGWALVDLIERAGTRRAPSAIVIDWIMTPASAEFIASLDASADPDHWQAAQRELFDIWIGDSAHAGVRHHLDQEMAAFDHEMWERSCQVIKAAYQQWGSPLQRMRALAETAPAPARIKHLFSQPTAPEYAQAQADFAGDNAWFSHRALGGPTHFPTLDSPALVAAEIRAAVAANDR